MHEPRLSDLVKLAGVLGVSVEELATGEKPNVITVHHGPLSLELPATEEGFAFLEAKLKEMTLGEKSQAASLKAG